MKNKSEVKSTKRKPKTLSKGKNWYELQWDEHQTPKGTIIPNSVTRSYIFEKGETYTLYKNQIKRISKLLNKSKNGELDSVWKGVKEYDVMFNTNHYHVIQLHLKSGGKVNWPIRETTIWTTNDLIELDQVEKIIAIPVTKKEYNKLIRWCY